MSKQVLVSIENRSDVGRGRRAAALLTQTLEFDAPGAGHVALAVTEACTNIIKHAGSGKLLLRTLEYERIAGLELLALDRGPGIANIGMSLRDGHSTAGSPGTGLGALSRAAAAMDLYSQAGKGTALRLEFWRTPPRGRPALQIGAVGIPKRGEEACGDDWEIVHRQLSHTVMVADGLGHGPDAARAARAAMDVLVKHAQEEPAGIMHLSHQALAGTRGAAVAIARFDSGSGHGSFAGIGNIIARVEAPLSRRNLVSHNGIVGHSLRKVSEFPLEFPADGVLILHTDGLMPHWTLADYPGLMAKHAGLIAGVLYRDHDRGRDDVTVVVIKRGSAP